MHYTKNNRTKNEIVVGFFVFLHAYYVKRHIPHGDVTQQKSKAYAVFYFPLRLRAPC